MVYGDFVVLEFVLGMAAYHLVGAMSQARVEQLRAAWVGLAVVAALDADCDGGLACGR